MLVRKSFFLFVVILGLLIAGGLFWFLFFKISPNVNTSSDINNIRKLARIVAETKKGQSGQEALIPGEFRDLPGDNNLIPDRVSVTGTIGFVPKSIDENLVLRVVTIDGREFNVNVNLTSPAGKIMFNPSDFDGTSKSVTVRALPVKEILPFLKLGQVVELTVILDGNLDRFEKNKNCKNICKMTIQNAREYYLSNLKLIDLLLGNTTKSNFVIGAVNSISL